MKQEGAKNDLAMNMPMAGGEKANDAAKKLDDAAKDVQKQLDQKKGQEANDQAALQPNKVDPQQRRAADSRRPSSRRTWPPRRPRWPTWPSTKRMQPMDGMQPMDRHAADGHDG